MVRGVHRKSRRYRSICTRTHFSGLGFGRSFDSGIKEVLYENHFPKDTKIARSARNEDYEGSLQEAHWRCRENFSGDRNDFTKVSRADEEAKSHLHRQIHWNLANLVKVYPGVFVHQRLTVPRQMVLRSVRRMLEGRSAVLLQSSLDEKWWADSTGCCCHLRNVQDLLADAKTPDERRL